MDLGFYTSIFRFKDERLSGDISPSYCTMPDDLIAEIMARFPKLKIVLMVRDPVARAWSHFTMKNRADKIDNPHASGSGQVPHAARDLQGLSHRLAGDDHSANG